MKLVSITSYFFTLIGGSKPPALRYLFTFHYSLRRLSGAFSFRLRPKFRYASARQFADEGYGKRLAKALILDKRGCRFSLPEEAKEWRKFGAEIGG